MKLVLVENDWHLLYLLYQLSIYHPEKVPDMDLMCPIVIEKPNQTGWTILFLLSNFKTLGIVLECFQVCQWNTALLEKRKRYYQKTKRGMTALKRFLYKEKWHS